MSTTPTTKTADFFFKSPIGTARYPRTQTLDTRFNEKGIYSVGLVLAPEELAAVEEELLVSFRRAYPDAKGDVKLPFKVDEAGARYLMAKSSFAPKVLDANRKPLESVTHGDRIRVVGRARPYKSPLMGGVALYLHAVDVIEEKPDTFTAPTGFMGDPLPF